MNLAQYQVTLACSHQEYMTNNENYVLLVHTALFGVHTIRHDALGPRRNTAAVQQICYVSSQLQSRTPQHILMPRVQ